MDRNNFLGAQTVELGNTVELAQTPLLPPHHLNCSDSETNTFIGTPPAPEDLWDTDNIHYLDKVKCKAWLWLTHIDPKNGEFKGRINLHWFLRAPNHQDRTEPRVRVPGLRVPRLNLTVYESRIWRDMSEDTTNTMCWYGTSSFEFRGFEIFEVQQFPFDRQIITLGLAEFVWRIDKDAATHEESIQVVSFTLETISMLPEWSTHKALVRPVAIDAPKLGPSYCTKFMIQLRIERKSEYYITQIFAVSSMILAASIMPLAMKPGGDKHVGDRLAIHSAGLLTLVAFKYGVQSDLPVVPYRTFCSFFLTMQIVTVVMVSFECIICYKLVDAWNIISAETMEVFEGVLLVALICGWIGFFFYAATQQRMTWHEVMENQERDVDPERLGFQDSRKKRKPTLTSTESFTLVAAHEDADNGDASYFGDIEHMTQATSLFKS